MKLLIWLKKINSYVPLFIRQNFLRKIIAVFFAILVYFQVSAELGEEKILQRIPVNFVTHGNVEVMQSKPATIDINVRGSKRAIRFLAPYDIQVDIPIDESILKQQDNQGDKTVTIAINKKNITLPTNIIITKINPSEISVYCDKNISKTVPITPMFSGKLPVDYEKKDIQITPQNVTLTGPEKMLKTIRTAIINPIDLDNTTTETFQVEKKVRQLDKKILVTPEIVQVKIEIFKTSGTTVYENIPIDLLSKQTVNTLTSKLLSNSVNVTLDGRISHLKALTKANIRAFVDISAFNKPGTYEAKVNCWINDPDIQVKFIEPAFVKVELATP